MKAESLDELLKIKDRNFSWWYQYAKFIGAPLTHDLRCNGKPIKKKIRMKMIDRSIKGLEDELEPFTLDELSIAYDFGLMHGYNPTNDPEIHKRDWLQTLKQIRDERTR